MKCLLLFLTAFLLLPNTSLTQILDVEGTAHIDILRVTDKIGIGSETFTPLRDIDARGSSPDDAAFLQLSNSNFSHRLLFFPGRTGDPNPYILWKSGDPLRFGTDEAGFNEKLRISSEGNIGIGIPSPVERLEVDGAINVGPNATQSPASGTIRWNDVTQDFEGYTGTKWKSLTLSKNTIFGKPFVTYNSRELNKITAADADSQDAFGVGVDISGNYAIIGAWGNDDHGDNSGSAYIYRRSGTTWIQQVKTTPNDAAAGDEFGTTVALFGNYAIVGASGKDNYSGAAYIFIRSGITWNQQAKITANDATAGDEFGIDVDVNGDYAIVGASHDDDSGDASGSAYIFMRSGTAWNQQAKITANDAATGDEFGRAVAIDGDYVIIGAHREDYSGTDSGAAYIFMRSGTSWNQQAKITANDAYPDDRFGTSVSISGDYVVVGARGDDDAGPSSGSVYIFSRSGTAWNQQAKITANDADLGDTFGISVDIDGDYIIVGAQFEDNEGGDNAGSAYIFVRSGTAWYQQAKFTTSEGATGDSFGISVSIDGQFAIIGSTGDDDAGTSSGSAYVY